MSIIWNKRVTEEGREKWVFDRETHVGLVMGASWTKEVRAMSDVYCDASYVQIWSPEKGEPETICLGYHFECSNEIGAVKSVDCPPELLKEWALKMAEKAKLAAEAEEKRQLAEAERVAELSLKGVRVGVEVEVVRGRKVPKGFRGKVFWMGESNYGPKVGIKAVKDGVETVYWIATSNVEAVVEGPKPGQTWTELLKEKLTKEEDLKKLLPKKGDIVRHESGVGGRVFWCKDTRLGVSRDGAPKGSDALWCNAWEVEVLNPDGSVKFKTPNPGGEAPVVEPPPEEPEPETSTPVPAPERKNPLAEFPAPLCDIRELRQESGVWNAYNADGVFIIRLPAASAIQIHNRLNS